MMEIGYIARDEKDRMLYFVMEAEGDVFQVHEPDFRIFLTQKVVKGCRISEIEKLMETPQQDTSVLSDRNWT